MIGRYPDENLPGHVNGDQRTVDILHADSGAEVTRFSDPGVKGLISVSKLYSLIRPHFFYLLDYVKLRRISKCSDRNKNRN